jgi:peptide/nickel transport system permease protein
MHTSSLRRMLRSPIGILSTALLLLILALAVTAPILWGEKAASVDPTAILQPPSSEHLLGTDSLGRDNFYRILVATRLTVGLALGAILLGTVVGLVLGAAPSVAPRRIGRMSTAAVNIAVAFPEILLALFLAVLFGVGTVGAVLAVGLSFAPQLARLTQTLAASVQGRDFIAAARIARVGRVRIFIRHVLPNIAEPLIVNVTIACGGALLAFAGLSFLGIGVQPPSYDWGQMLGDGLSQIYTSPAAALGPGVAVVIAALAFNLFGETAAAAVGLRTGRPQMPASPTRHEDAAAPDPAHDAARPTGDATHGSEESTATEEAQPVLTVEDLHVAFPGRDDWIRAVRGVTFSIAVGETVGIVGESGSGKSVTALAASRLIESPGAVSAARLEFLGTPLLTTSERKLRTLLGTSLAMVFQDPMSSFNPTSRVGPQLAEVAQQHYGLRRRAALTRAVDRLRSVRIPSPARRARQYPHEFSGGMRQRAMIGMGLMGTPRLIVADEPTTALDVTVQRQVLELLGQIREETKTAVLLISHDLGVVSQVCDRVMVMYSGKIVEDLPIGDLWTSARHPYTRALIAAIPDVATDRDRPLAVIPGRLPEPGRIPPGCAFAARCGFATDKCRSEDPTLDRVDSTRRLACWHPVINDAEAPENRQNGSVA